jgi:hypothetical protein
MTSATARQSRAVLPRIPEDANHEESRPFGSGAEESAAQAGSLVGTPGFELLENPQFPNEIRKVSEIASDRLIP